MEEILASIRKIISDDTAPAPSPVAVVPDPEPDFANDEDDAESVLDLVEDVADEVVEEVMFDDEEEESFESVEEFEVEDFGDDLTDESVADETSETFESLLEAARAAEPAPAPQPAPAPAVTETPAPVETPMPAAQRVESIALTEETTATAAAGALSKLISRMDLGGEHTLEGLVRELVRPMIKEWLDANLPAIVEEKVELEVQRIARMAR